jgi:hypothetical protein
VSTPAEDKDLEEYLRRKSALSLGYKKIYIEAPPEELDRAITARARRALRWLVPGVLSLLIALGLVVGINVGVDRLVTVSVKAEQNAVRIKAEREKQIAEERARQPVAVVIDASNIEAQAQKDAAERAEDQKIWLEKIEELRKAGKTKEADIETQIFNEKYSPSRK